MEKQRIIKEKTKIIDWVLTWQEVPESYWVLPIREGAWGPVEVIAHFSFWDKFVIDNRLKPFLLKEEPRSDTVDVQQLNDGAASYAKKRTPAEIIQDFKKTRLLLVSMVEALPKEIFSQPMAGKDITWSHYFKGLIEHDEEHCQQIEEHFKKISTSNSGLDLLEE
ncbi:hypothetical protein [Bacillus sp. AK031]